MLAICLLKGEALTEFKLQVQKLATDNVPMAETSDTILKCLDAVQNSVFLACTLLLQKCYMHRNMSKPHSMATQKWLA